MSETQNRPVYVTAAQADLFLSTAIAERRQQARVYVALLDENRDDDAKKVLDEIINLTGLIDVLNTLF